MASTIATGGPAQGPNWGGFAWGAAAWDQAAGGSFANLVYNSEHQRMEMSTASASTYYFNDPTSGAVAEYYAPTNGGAQWRDYVMADGRMVAERTAPPGGAATWQYFVADHLGSIAVVVNAAGAVSERMIYDPWGLQLSPSGADLCGVGTPTTRGFTGEEQMPLDCLVNLNARVYDPVIGRFLTGDPVISSLYDQQALNRYSYTYNNPLSLTDVNGECPICLFIIDVIADVIFAEVLKPVFERVPILGDLWIIADSLYCGPLCAAEDAGVLAGVKSGSIGKAVEAFALTYAEAEAFNEVGNLKGDFASGKFGITITGDAYTATSFVLHGLVGGTFSVLQGGKFGSGFLSAGVSDLATPYIMESSNGNVALGTAESAVLGGTTSVIGGGKFGNGAITGAFGYLFNAAQHPPGMGHNGGPPLDAEEVAEDVGKGLLGLVEVPVLVLGGAFNLVLGVGPAGADSDSFTGLQSGMLRDALAGRLTGNLTYPGGPFTVDEANEIGEGFVGPDATMMSDDKGLVSADGLRAYRFPTDKSYGGTFGNLEARQLPQGAYNVNIHIPVEP